MGTRFTDMSSGFGRDPVMTASNLRGRQHERSMQQGSQVL